MTERQGQAGDAFTGHSACPFLLYARPRISVRQYVTPGGSTQDKFENFVFICLCARLSLSLNKIGCGSA